MKKCLVCNKEIENGEEEICHTCFDFFKWRYKGLPLRKRNLFIFLNKKIRDSGSIKFRRKK